VKINYYALNLNRSPDRWAAISEDARACGITLTRIAAVDGKDVPPQERTILDEAGFRRWHGKIPLDGEYGCYQSHLNAFDAFLASDADAAVVFEDDAQPLPSFRETIEALVAVDDWDLVKLMHHRMALFSSLRALVGDRKLGKAWFGPTGGSAAYLVNRFAAQRLREKLVPMQLPYDVALERGWSFGLRVRHVRPDLVRANPETKATLIGGPRLYAKHKLPPYRRLSTLAFRTGELVRRAIYAAGPR
jgi:glycosyl transferase family 25